MRAWAALLFSCGLLTTGCENTGPICAAGTVLSSDGTECVAAGSDMGASACGENETLVNGKCEISNSACGPNLALMNGKCVATASICQAPGTVFDQATGTCKRPELGTQVDTANFIHDYHHIFYAVPDGGAPTDAGGTDTVKVIGNFDTQVAQIPDATTLVNKFGVPLGGFFQTTGSPVGPPVGIPTAVDPDRKFTLADYKACGGTVSWYKPPQKTNGKATYLQVVDVAGCMPQTLYTVWNFYTPDGTRANSFMVTAAGGLPNVFVTDDNGAGHWERLQDADIYFKAGANLPYAGTHTPPAIIPDPATQPNAGIVTSIAYHSNAQTNGNVGFCVKDTSNNCGGGPCCVTPQPNILSVGNPAVDVHHMLINEPGTKLSLLQPY